MLGLFLQYILSILLKLSYRFRKDCVYNQYRYYSVTVTVYTCDTVSERKSTSFVCYCLLTKPACNKYIDTDGSNISAVKPHYNARQLNIFVTSHICRYQQRLKKLSGASTSVFHHLDSMPRSVADLGHVYSCEREFLSSVKEGAAIFSRGTSVFSHFRLTCIYSI